MDHYHLAGANALGNLPLINFMLDILLDNPYIIKICSQQDGDNSAKSEIIFM